LSIIGNIGSIPLDTWGLQQKAFRWGQGVGCGVWGVGRNNS